MGLKMFILPSCQKAVSRSLLSTENSITARVASVPYDRNYVLNRISEERDYQDHKWGDSDDLQNTPADFITYINHYSTRYLDGTFRPYSAETLFKFREGMIQSAAIAVAAAEFAGKLLNDEISRPDVLKAD